MVISHLVSIKGPHLHGGAEHSQGTCNPALLEKRGGRCLFLSLQVLMSPQKYIGGTVVG